MRLRTLAPAVALALTAGLAVPAAAQRVIDQNQPSFLPNATLTDITNSFVAQTFRTNAPNISGVGVLLGGFGPNFSRLSVWSGRPGANGSQRLATVNNLLQFPGPDFTNQWSELFFDPIATVPGQEYWLVVSGNFGIPFVRYQANAYANGNAWFGGGSELSEYTAFTPGDLAFRTYTNVVPEPSTYA
ncbi:MAG: hypothetical protein MUF21_11305, partial [Gemmatimonadaceae bacterium]|nr:hypothetical protein [Gemmatimonadaceae bacterium]